MRILSIIWYEAIIFKRRFWSITLGMMVSPILYLIAFGWGLGATTVNGMSYLSFVIPGIIAMSSMTNSYSTVANNINIARTYDKTFEEFMIAPLNMRSYAFGKILASALRGIYSALLIVLLCLIFKAGVKFDLYTAGIIVLNCLVFSAMGFIVGILIESHMGMSKFQNFVMTPMSFLCGTFFPLESMPVVLKQIIWILPLSQTSIAMRRDSALFINSWLHPLILVVYFVVLTAIGIRLCKKAE
jgi:ABC-type multidrug transport system permease subunit